jgi:hypothetical protein
MEEKRERSKEKMGVAHKPVLFFYIAHHSAPNNILL